VCGRGLSGACAAVVVCALRASLDERALRAPGAPIDLRGRPGPKPTSVVARHSQSVAHRLRQTQPGTRDHAKRGRVNGHAEATTTLTPTPGCVWALQHVLSREFSRQRWLRCAQVLGVRNPDRRAPSPALSRSRQPIPLLRSIPGTFDRCHHRLDPPSPEHPHEEGAEGTEGEHRGCGGQCSGWAGGLDRPNRAGMQRATGRAARPRRRPLEAA
jgi:hypothetical protein